MLIRVEGREKLCLCKPSFCRGLSLNLVSVSSAKASGSFDKKYLVYGSELLVTDEADEKSPDLVIISSFLALVKATYNTLRSSSTVFSDSIDLEEGYAPGETLIT